MVFFHWRLCKKLGEGSFAGVYKACAKTEGEKEYAMKIIEKHRFDNFTRAVGSSLLITGEIDVLNHLCHPNIISLHSAFQTSTQTYLVTEILVGGSLLQCLLEDGVFTDCDASNVFLQLCKALSFIHEKCFVHRDIKPDNVLLNTRNRTCTHAKLADFGLARESSSAQDCKTWCGSPLYCAPEVFAAGRFFNFLPNNGYGRQSDLWSLGVTLYVMLSGIFPFDEADLPDVIIKKIITWKTRNGCLLLI